MERPLPLSTLLSKILVAFTIEFDNKAGHRMQHRTTHGRSALGTMPAPHFHDHAPCASSWPFTVVDTPNRS